jgi:transposase
MAKEILPDELWGALEPLFPSPPPRPKGGRRRIPNRAALTGILFVLRTGIPWEWLPLELGCGSGMTCWRRLRDWQAQGVWRKVHRTLLNALGDAAQIDWQRAAIDSASVPAPRGARTPARIRRIAANRARSATVWSTSKGSRWPSPSRRPMSRMGRGWNPPSMPSNPSSDPAGGRASAQPSCTPTRRMMPPRSAGSCNAGGSRLGLHGAAWSPRRDWGGTAGSWNGHMPGSTASAV